MEHPEFTSPRVLAACALAWGWRVAARPARHGFRWQWLFDSLERQVLLQLPVEGRRRRGHGHQAVERAEGPPPLLWETEGERIGGEFHSRWNYPFLFSLLLGATSVSLMLFQRGCGWGFEGG